MQAAGLHMSARAGCACQQALPQFFWLALTVYAHTNASIWHVQQQDVKTCIKIRQLLAGGCRAC